MQKLLAIGLLLFVSGLALVLVGASEQGSVSTGGVVFVGPFPIVFGSGPGGLELAMASALIGGVMVALILLWGWRFLRTKGE